MSLVPSLLKKPESILEKLCGFLEEQNVELSSLCAGSLFQPASRGALLVASVLVGVRGRAVSGRPPVWASVPEYPWKWLACISFFHLAIKKDPVWELEWKLG